jgi:methionine synthase II (cobalamin-independent)
MAAQIPTASGFGRLRAPDRQTVVERLRTVLAAADSTVVHCCAARPPVSVFVDAGAGALSLDGAVLTPYDDDDIGLAVEDGLQLLLGLVPSLDADLSDLDARMAPAKQLWRRLGFASERMPTTVVPTPSCGLAGASPTYAVAALQACVEMARRMGEEPE